MTLSIVKSDHEINPADVKTTISYGASAVFVRVKDWPVWEIDQDANVQPLTSAVPPFEASEDMMLGVSASYQEPGEYVEQSIVSCVAEPVAAVNENQPFEPDDNSIEVP